jgi:hypothetical protein
MTRAFRCAKPIGIVGPVEATARRQAVYSTTGVLEAVKIERAPPIAFSFAQYRLDSAVNRGGAVVAAICWRRCCCRCQRNAANECVPWAKVMVRRLSWS